MGVARCNMTDKNGMSTARNLFIAPSCDCKELRHFSIDWSPVSRGVCRAEKWKHVKPTPIAGEHEYDYVSIGAVTQLDPPFLNIRRS